MKKTTQFLIVATLLALIVAFVCADISVHCLHDQIVGTWKFSMTNVLIQNQKALDKRVFLWCNRTDEAYGYNTQNYVSDVYVKLVKPNKALVYDKDDSDKIISSGTWTMIYDQGFEVIVDQKKFFAFNDFSVEKNGEFVTSYCGKTQAGWFHNVDGDTEYGCFKGEKVNSNEKTDTVTTKVVNNALHSYMYQKFKNEHELVNKLNQVQKGWTAKTYKEYDRLTVGQMRGRAGHKVSQHDKPKSLLSDNDQFEALGDAPGLLSGNEHRGDSSYETRAARAKLPKAWDWRNVSGENFVSQVRHQQSCGSCYIFATMTMLESRIRIQSKNKDQVVLAPQDVVSCSLYSQLCHGGFPYLASKYVQDFYVVPEDCFPYKATSDLSCNKKCASPSYRVGVSNYTYIGGFYGASSELSMMKEIYHNGPIAVSFLVYPDFSYYSKGVYSHIKGIAGKEERVKHGGVNPWEPVTHSVAIVGWGVDEENTGHKYWIVKNSWGEDWGEAGYFKIRKGVDECSIESEAVAAMPYLQRL